MDGGEPIMNIVLHSPQFLPLVGGVENVVFDWGNALCQLGNKVSIITYTNGQNDTSWPFMIYRKPGLWKELQILRKADVVMQFNVSLKGFIPIFLSGSALVVSHQSSVFFADGSSSSSTAKIKMWIAKNYAKLNIACSAYLAEVMGLKAAIIPNPYNESLFKNKHHLVKKYDIVFLGRLVSDKGCAILLEALSILKSKGFTPSVQIIGDGNEKTALKNWATTHGLQEQIEFQSALRGSALVEALNNSKLMVVPSVWEEPFGIVALEGLACGCTVIVSASGGLPEAIGQVGFTFPKGNALALSVLLEKYLIVKKTFEKKPEDIYQHLQAHTPIATAKKLLDLLRKV